LPDRSGPAEGLSRDDLDVTYDSEANNTSLFYRGLSPHGGNAGECRSYIGRLCKLSYLDGIETLDGLLRYDTNEIYSGRPKRALKSEDPFFGASKTRDDGTCERAPAGHVLTPKRHGMAGSSQTQTERQAVFLHQI
jgi:hypothetical protein